MAAAKQTFSSTLYYSYGSFGEFLKDWEAVLRIAYTQAI
jgi:hypothetical protein